MKKISFVEMLGLILILGICITAIWTNKSNIVVIGISIVIVMLYIAIIISKGTVKRGIKK